jgi:hypothetical protein
MWIDKLAPVDREKVLKEQEKRERALKAWIGGRMPKRTAQRIVERCNKRIGLIATRFVEVV